MFFQPGVDINLAMSQVTAFAQTTLRAMPPGITPPLILKYNASSVPILQLALSSEQAHRVADLRLRQPVHPLADRDRRRRRRFRYPFGGARARSRWICDPDALRAQGLSAVDVNTAIGNQNLILPAGTQKIGDTEYSVKLNASPLKLDELNDLPMQATMNGAVTYLRDVAFVHDGHPPQTNIVRVDGRRAVLMTIQKTGSASTLEHRRTPSSRGCRQIRELLPEGATIAATGDQSVFVKAAVHGRGGGRAHRRRPDGTDDPAVPRQLAQHADHHDLDSAVDPRRRSSCSMRWARRSTS